MSDPFVYTSAAENLGTVDTHVAIVHAGVADKAQLFGSLIAELRLPKYFGVNWDALDECLRDLSWIQQHRVVLFHEALPDMDEDDLTTYLEILRDAVLDWRRDEDDELVVGFPLSAQGPISRLLGQ